MRQSSSLQSGTRNLTIDERIKILQESYRNYASTKTVDTVKYQQQFFNAFPDNFKDFEAIYGFDDNTGVEAPLYKDLQYSPHIDSLFNKLKVIDKEAYYSKLISVSIGGKWDADNVTSLQQGLRQHIYADLSLTLAIIVF
jgi:hypothetical protein